VLLSIVVAFFFLKDGAGMWRWIVERLGDTGGLALAGLLGVFLAVPVTAAGFVTLSELRAAGIVGPPVAADHTRSLPADEPP
jgi:predicted PurR-regulated permease PerM